MFIDEIVIDPINQITTKSRYDPNEQNQEKVTSFDNSISSETKILDGETKSELEENPENFANFKENYTAKYKYLKYFSEQALMIVQASL